MLEGNVITSKKKLHSTKVAEPDVTNTTVQKFSWA